MDYGQQTTIPKPAYALKRSGPDARVHLPGAGIEVDAGLRTAFALDRLAPRHLTSGIRHLTSDI